MFPWIEMWNMQVSREVKAERGCCSALCRHSDVQPADRRPLQAGTIAIVKHEEDDCRLIITRICSACRHLNMSHGTSSMHGSSGAF
jgi:hypothetical protein